MGAIGRIYPDGRLDVIATEQESCNESVRYGIVQNVEETAIRISRVLHHLEQNPNVAPYEITGVFVGLAGRSLRSIDANVEIQLPEETIVDTELMQKLRSRAEEKAIDTSLEVIDAVPRSFLLGKTTTKHPIGNLCTGIRATYDLIVCRPQIRRNIERIDLQNRINVKVNGFIVTPLATGKVLLKDGEKRLGCMLVDLGAETTTVTIYKDGNLIYLATLPMGSRNITRDLTSLSLLEEAAEDLKVTSGNAIPNEKVSALNIHGVKSQDISNYIVARADEIVVNILEQINYAGLKDSDLPGGIILIGGGTQLTNMEELIRKTSKMKVRRAELPGYITTSGETPKFEALQTLSVLYAGAEHSDAECLSKPQPRELPDNGIPNEDDGYDDIPSSSGRRRKDSGKRPKAPSRWSKIWSGISNVLTPGSDDEEEDDGYSDLR